MEPIRRLTPMSAPPGGPRPGRVRLPSAPRDTFEGRAEEAAPEARSRWKQRAVAAALAGVAVAGVGAGLAGHALVNAPVCPEPSPALSITREGVCVSPEVGTQASAGWRALRSLRYADQAVQDLASSQNRLYEPRSEVAPAPLPADGGLRVASWNLHHGQSEDRTGARDQIDAMIRVLRSSEADVYLLQEVSPWHVQDLVDALGMPGYYSQTTPLQGDLILVHPGLQVRGDAKEVLNVDVPEGDRSAALRALHAWVDQGGGVEPRLVQALQVVLPDGRPAVLWNTHLSTSKASNEARAAEQARLVDFLEGQARPGTPILGGGDLNAGARHGPVPLLAERGHQAQGASIDWLVSRDLSGTLEVAHRNPTDARGTRLSDHPLVEGDLHPR